MDEDRSEDRGVCEGIEDVGLYLNRRSITNKSIAVSSSVQVLADSGFAEFHSVCL